MLCVRAKKLKFSMEMPCWLSQKPACFDFELSENRPRFFEKLKKNLRKMGKLWFA
jgi:hypothetical protein